MEGGSSLEAFRRFPSRRLASKRNRDFFLPSSKMQHSRPTIVTTSWIFSFLNDEIFLRLLISGNFFTAIISSCGTTQDLSTDIYLEDSLWEPSFKNRLRISYR